MCLVTTLLYPFYTVNGFPSWSPPTSEFWIIVGLECIYAFDIMMNFFLQTLDEEGKSQELPLEMVAVQYLKQGFLTDLIVLIPFGGILSLVEPRFEILWLIKAIRIKDLHYYLNIRQFQPLINSFIEYKQQKSL